MTDRPALTDSERQLFEPLREHFLTGARPPTYQEMATWIGASSTRAVGYLIERLEEKGYVSRGVGHRSLSIVGESPGLTLPLLGPVAAGRPISCPEPGGDRFDFASHFGGEDAFMLTVAGDSMIEDHIVPGDLIVVRGNRSAVTGETVVVRIAGEYTLKVYRSLRGKTWLFPRNPAHEPRRLDEDCELVGVLIGVVRTTRGRR